MVDVITFIAALGLMASVLGAEVIGRKIALRSDRNPEHAAVEVGLTGHVLTSTFGLLALLLGFSFGIAINRFDSRRVDVVAEANAIGTAQYRAGFLGERSRELQESLERYAAQRLTHGHSGLAARPQMESVSADLRSEIAAAGQLLQPVANTPLGA